MTPRPSIARLADCAPVPHADSWPARRPPSLAMASTCTKLEIQASRTVRAMIKERALAYARRPRDLDAIADWLSTQTPRNLVLCLDRFVVTMRMKKKPRWFGNGGEVPALNLRAAMLYARWSRRKASRNARGARDWLVEGMEEEQRNARRPE